MNLSKSKKLIGSLMLMATIVLGCGSTADILSTPIENIDTSPLKVTELTESEKKNWGHLDLERAPNLEEAGNFFIPTRAASKSSLIS